MRKLYHVIAFNLAKSRAAQNGNKYTKEHYHPSLKVLEPGKNILVRDHDSKVFKPKYLDYCIVKMAGKNQVIVEDNHGHKIKVHRRDLKVIDSDTKVAEMYEELRKEGRRGCITLHASKTNSQLGRGERNSTNKNGAELKKDNKGKNRNHPEEQ